MSNHRKQRGPENVRRNDNEINDINAGERECMLFHNGYIMTASYILHIPTSSIIRAHMYRAVAFDAPRSRTYIGKQRNVQTTVHAAGHAVLHSTAQPQSTLPAVSRTYSKLN
jgi:hypothetical protein